jgi:site-specific recombinase XerD
MMNAIETWNEAVSAFVRYLETEVGLLPTTVSSYQDTLRVSVGAFLTDEAPDLLARPGNLRPDHAARFIGWGREQGWKGSTINHHLIVWRVFIRWMVYDGSWGVDRNLLEWVERVRYRTPERPVWTLAQAQHFLATVEAVSDNPALDVAMFGVFLTTGLRLFEVLGLEWERVDYEGRRIRVRGKGSKERVVPLVEWMVGHLVAYQGRERRSTGRVFRRPDGTPCGREYAKSRLQRFAAAAGLTQERQSLHQLRHTALTLLIEAGVDVYTVKEMAGHASLNTTGHYLHLAGHDLVARYRAVAPF